MEHRIFKCTHPDVVAARADLLKPDVLAEMSASRPCAEAIQGWSPSPPLPPPCCVDEFEQAIVQRAVKRPGAGGIGDVEWQACEWSELRASVHHHSAQMCCFTDGSMFKEDWKSSWRAGWGVYVDRDSQPAFRAFGLVAGSAQTVPTAEWTAVFVASSFWPPSAAPPVSDCLSVVRGVNNIQACVRRGGALAGLAKASLKKAAGTVGSLFGLTKVKAHQAMRWDMEASALRAASGNSFADAAAKAGASMHPAPSPVERAVFLHWWSHSLMLAQAVGRILALFPTVIEQFGGKLGRLAAVGGGGERRSVTRRSIVPFAFRHRFATVGGAVMCQRCLARARSWRSAQDRTLHQECPGQCQALVEAWLADQHGHSLQLLSHAGLATVVCIRCGAFASTHRSELLSSPCRGAAGMSEQRRGGLRRLRNGRHPDSRRSGFLDATWVLAGGELTELTF